MVLTICPLFPTGEEGLKQSPNCIALSVKPSILQWMDMWVNPITFAVALGSFPKCLLSKSWFLGTAIISFPDRLSDMFSSIFQNLTGITHCSLCHWMRVVKQEGWCLLANTIWADMSCLLRTRDQHNLSQI